MHTAIVDVVKLEELRGVITIELPDEDEDDDIVIERMIEMGELQTIDPRIDWFDPEYVDGSFGTTM